MPTLSKNIVISAPPEKIWAILADVARTPEWIMGVQESERTGAVREGKGLRWRERSLLENQNIEMDHEMTGWEPMNRFRVRTALPMNGRMEKVIELQPAAGGVDVKILVDWDLGIAGMLLGEKKTAALMDSIFTVTLANLKELAEKPEGG